MGRTFGFCEDCAHFERAIGNGDCERCVLSRDKPAWEPRDYHSIILAVPKERNIEEDD